MESPEFIQIITIIIQTIALVVLVIITIYYAIQTNRQVLEQKEKRKLDFFERKIRDFYNPMMNRTDKIKELIRETVEKNWEEISMETEAFFKYFEENSYLINLESRKKFMELLIDFKKFELSQDEFFQDIEDLKIPKEELLEKLEGIYKLLEQERGKIEAYFDKQYFLK